MTTIRGVDVASFQGLPGQWAAAAGAIDFGAVKLTELQPGGTRYVNPDAAADWAYLGAQGKARIAYLFGHPSTSAATTVSFFVSELAKLGVEDADMIAIDLETANGLTAAKVALWTADVAGLLRLQLSRTPLLYTYLSFAQAGNCAGLGHLPLWISDPSSPAGKPRIPAPWTSWHLHQHGITGAIDRDVARYPTIAAMRADLGKPAPKPPPPSGDPMKFLASLTADAPQQIPAGGKPVVVKWKASGTGHALLGPERLAVKLPAAAVLLSAACVHLTAATSVRLAVIPTSPAGDRGAAIARDHDTASGYVDFVMPFGGKEGWKYELAVSNYGKDPVTVDSATWQLIE
jgi:lysozyme